MKEVYTWYHLEVFLNFSLWWALKHRTNILQTPNTARKFISFVCDLLDIYFAAVFTLFS
jgi:hypothetical protein